MSRWIGVPVLMAFWLLAWWWNDKLMADADRASYARGYAAAVDSVRAAELRPLSMSIGPLDTVSVWREASGEMRAHIHWNMEARR